MFGILSFEGNEVVGNELMKLSAYLCISVGARLHPTI